MPAHIETGLDRLVATGFAALQGTRVGVVSNPTAVDRRYRHLVDHLMGTESIMRLGTRHAAEHAPKSMINAKGEVEVVGVFGPEHGFRGSAQAGFSEGAGVDARTGLPVYDAYQADRVRWRELLTSARVQTVVFDIQDVGARFYTYIWTMYDSLCAARDLGLRYVVLDRPNPIGGTPRGPVLKPGYESGVGRREIAQQHGMTIGELARMFDPEVEVMACVGWERHMLARDTDAPWVMPSPNLPTPDTALVYPGTGMFEGTNLSEGRGTTRPFELVGAPWLDYLWSDRLNTLELAGVEFREAYFTPTFEKHEHRLCAGVEVKVTDATTFDAVLTGVAMLVEARKYPEFQWRPDWIDKLTGSSRLRTMIDAGAAHAEVAAAWDGELAEFTVRSARYSSSK